MVQGGSVLISQNAFATLALSSLNGPGTVFLRTGCAMTITQKAVKTRTARLKHLMKSAQDKAAGARVTLMLQAW